MPPSHPFITRSDIATRITNGALLIIYRSRVLHVTSWAPYHPGGALALLHFVGRDATDEIEAYHPASALRRVEKLAVGRVEVDEDEGWRPLTPPIALGLVAHPDGIKGHWAREGSVALGEAMLQRGHSSSAQIPSTSIPNLKKSSSIDIITLHPSQLEPATSSLDPRTERVRSRAYQHLKICIAKAGLFDRPGPLAGYGSDLLRYTLLGGTAFGLFFVTTGWIGQMASATFLGFFFHQLTFVTNHPEHDPDIQHIPFFAISKQFFGSLWSTYYKRVMAFDGFSKTMISVQHKLYYIVLSLARFNLYANSYTYLLGPKPKHDGFWRFELTGVAFFWLYFGSMLRNLPTWQMRLGYILVSHIVSSPVHVQIVLSHFACSTEDLGPTESFPSRQLRTTMDVICSPELEFIHGGLHLQVTHHLFPRLPRHHLREASLLVKEYCQEQEILYREHGFVEGNRQVLSVLKDVADQLQFLKTVADAEIDEKFAQVVRL